MYTTRSVMEAYDYRIESITVAYENIRSAKMVQEFIRYKTYNIRDFSINPHYCANPRPSLTFEARYAQALLAREEHWNYYEQGPCN